MAVKARLLTYDGSLVPDGGSAVLCSLAGPLKLDGKDAAGHSFHLFALKQAGLHSEPGCMPSQTVHPQNSCMRQTPKGCSIRETELAACHMLVTKMLLFVHANCASFTCCLQRRPPLRSQMRPARWAVTLPSGLQPQAQMSITHLGECWRSTAMHLLLRCKESPMAAGGGEVEHELLLQRWQPAPARRLKSGQGTLTTGRICKARLRCSAELLLALPPDVV